MIVFGYTLGFISILIGGIFLFTRGTRIDDLYGYVLAASGVVLIFASTLARRSSRNAAMLKLVLGGFALLLLLGFLLKGVIARNY